MGGGNAQKSATARDRKLKEAAGKGAGSQLKVNQQAMSIVCQICRQSFMCTATESKLKEHTDSKHAKAEFKACFPNFPVKA